MKKSTSPLNIIIDAYRYYYAFEFMDIIDEVLIKINVKIYDAY